MEIMAFWLEFQRTLDQHQAAPAGLSRVGMAKSACLGRLMRGEELRRRPCPKHKGKMWCGWGEEKWDRAEYKCCNGTGCLRNETDEE